MAGAPHLEKFLDAAKYFIGLKESGENSFTDSRGRELWSLWGWNASGTPWCAIFVSACAQKAGIANKIIAKDSYAIGVQAKTVDKYGGTWIDGPLINGGKPVTPIPGDLITFGNSSYHGHGSASHVGIVEYVQDGQVHTIEGNTGNQCARRTYDLSHSTINAYVRPDWSKVGDDITSYLANAGQLTLGPLYQNRNDRHDMTLRQVGYINNKYELSNSSSDLAVSIINYTTALGDLYNMFAPGALAQSTIQVDTSQLQGNIKITMDYLLDKGFSASGASAVTGCLYTYSHLDPQYKVINGGTKYYLYGIGQWTSTQLIQVKKRIGDTWATDLSGQLDCVMYDLATTHSVTILDIKSKPVDIESVNEAVEVFMREYRSQYRLEYFVNQAKKTAADIFGKLIITKVPITGSVANLRDMNGNQLSAKSNVAIPASVPQTGIIDDFTSYSKFYHKWASKSPQRQLADIWSRQGCPCNRGVATIGGYYCIAVRPKFGTCGDVLVVTLEGGTQFPAIICDEKGSDAGSEWGHVKYAGKISVIEWERVKTRNGKVATEDVGYAEVDKHGFSDWYGKKVLSITNYGKYADVNWRS